MKDFPVVDGVLILPEGMTYLRNQQFCTHEDIRKVVVPPGVGFMEEEVFAECPNLEEVVLPEGLIHIGVAAFADCVKLRQIRLPSTVRSIGEGGFLGCESLEEIDLPEGLEEISTMAFMNSGLRSVRIPDTVKRIGEEAFFECPQLERIEVCGRDTVIEEDAFGSNYRLKEGYVAGGYPEEKTQPVELLYTLLWCSCPDRHEKTTSERARRFIREQEDLVMEWIFRLEHVSAMHTLVNQKLLSLEHLDRYLRQALDRQQTEITALLLSAKADGKSLEEEFEL